jgi:hypothetical protein
MRSLEAKSALYTVGTLPKTATIKRLLWQAPARLVFSILLVLIAAALYTIFPVLHSHDILYICLLLGLFVASVWGFEDLLTRISAGQREESRATSIPRQELYPKPIYVPYASKDWGNLLNTLSVHRRAIYQENPALFEKFRAEAQQRAILIVQDVQPPVDLLKKAFDDFGFRVFVCVITSPDANHNLRDYAKRVDLVVWHGRSSHVDPVTKRLVDVAGTRVLAASAITGKPDVLKRAFAQWLSPYPETFADAFFWHLFQAAAAIPKATAFSPSGASGFEGETP